MKWSCLLCRLTANSSPWKRVLAFSLLLLLVFGCDRQPAASGDLTAEGLAVRGSDLHDFGEQRQNEVLRHQFLLINHSTVPIQVTGLTTSCHCVVAGDEQLEPLTIPPGDSFSLPVSFTTGSSREEATGRVIVSYQEVLGAAGSPPTVTPRSLTLQVRADVLPGLPRPAA